jgi:hypothetical protein
MSEGIARKYLYYLTSNSTSYLLAWPVAPPMSSVSHHVTVGWFCSSPTLAFMPSIGKLLPHLGSTWVECFARYDSHHLLPWPLVSGTNVLVSGTNVFLSRTLLSRFLHTAVIPSSL